MIISNKFYWLKKIFRFFKYHDERRRLFREISIKKIQNSRLKKSYYRNTSSLIIYLCPGANSYDGKETISGGVISLVSICEETVLLKDIHLSETIMCIFPREPLFLNHINFSNITNLFRLQQLPKYFKNVKKITIHIPEYLGIYFRNSLLTKEENWLKKIENVHINIINANILLMPKNPRDLLALKDIASKLTITAAHSRYCTKYYRELYGLPLHKFSAWVSPEKYKFKNFADKRQLVVISPDPNPYREKIINKLKLNPNLEILTLKGLKYSDFLDIIGKAKWAITFGEGLDGYILEPIFSGTIGFAVYNEQFFTEDFLNMPGIYNSYQELENSILSEIERTDNPDIYSKMQKKQYDICSSHYNYEEYKMNIRKFYQLDYTFK